MTDTITKVLGVLLAAILLLLAPLTINTMVTDMGARRIALNEVENFIDKVTDKGSISAYDMNDLALGLAASGVAFDFQVYRYIGIKYSSSGVVNTAYILSDDNFNTLSGTAAKTLESGDRIQVEVKAIEYTKGQNLLKSVFKIYGEQYTFKLAGTVR